jgi:ABC-type proline/glycine betaine transport system permease subunit
MMAVFLKLVSALYLIFVWAVFAVAVSKPFPLASSVGNETTNVITLFIAIGLSIPAVALFGFAQIVGDVRMIRNQARMQSEHLRAMRAYYEPQHR